jgi:nucleotide-binding universal stress UspA family protein
MSIICGTDFTDASAEALTVASCLAAKMQTPLHLVHAVTPPLETDGEAAHHELLRIANSRLERQAAKLRPSGLHVECHSRSGVPDEVIRELARELSGKLIVVGALGQRRPDAWQLGSHADRTAERSHIPVLVVRQAEAFADWLSGSRPLRIALGVDASLS